MMLRPVPRRALALAAVILLAALAACYLPNNFRAEIRIGKTGDFAIAYYGELIWAPLYRDIQTGKITSDQIPKEIAQLHDDLARDPGFSLVESMGQGRFKVAYKREGPLKASQEVTFVRRNAIILLIRASPDGRVTINGASMRPADTRTISDMGLSLKGEFRIITDGLVKENNATHSEPYDGGYQLYVWTIDSPFAPPPHFVMQREGVWPAKPAEKQ